jgi:hypothetical protein
MERRGRAATLACMTVVAVTGCSPGSEQDVAARVDDWVLTGRELGDLLVLAQPFPLESEAVEELALHWIGVAALAVRYAAGDAVMGDDAASHSMWLEAREALLAADREDRLGPIEVDPEQAFRDGDYRLLAHVLRRVGPETSRDERELERRTAERVLAGLVGGGSWEEAVTQSQDLETRESSGLLGLFARGELPTTLDRVALRLQPGEVSSVVESDQGFHILYRPRFLDVANLYRSRLQERRLAEADTVSAEGLLERRGFELGPGAVEEVRGLAERPGERFTSQDEIAGWEGGALTLGTVARYAAALPEASRVELRTASNEAVRDLIEDVARRELRILDAGARSVRADPELLARLGEQHANEVRGWIADLDLDGGGPAHDRARLREYMRNVAARRVEARSLPPLFEAWLLQRVDWSLSEAGIVRSIEEARAMLEASG